MFIDAAMYIVAVVKFRIFEYGNPYELQYNVPLHYEVLLRRGHLYRTKLWWQLHMQDSRAAAGWFLHQCCILLHHCACDTVFIPFPPSPLSYPIRSPVSRRVPRSYLARGRHCAPVACSLYCVCQPPHHATPPRHATTPPSRLYHSSIFSSCHRTIPPFLQTPLSARHYGVARCWQRLSPTVLLADRLVPVDPPPGCTARFIGNVG